jgi:3-methyladenine DNA glycosylase/8-oxoguanine DNA glycosylase
MPVADRLVEAMAIILRSVDVRFSTDRAPESIRFALTECPILKAADEPGYSLRLPVVHLGFAALCEAIVNGLAPSWQLIKPLVEESELPLGEVHFARR